MQALDFPERLTVEPTNICNYACAMCPSRHNSTEPKGMMSPDLFDRIVGEARDYAPALVPFFRGESLLHPNLVDFITLAKANGLGPVQLATNGSLLTEKLAKALLDTGLDFISFSLDTVIPAEYAAIRVGGDLQKVMAKVLAFMALRDKGGYETEIQVSATRTDLNQDSMPEFVEYWWDKVDRTRIYYEHSKDGNTGSLDCPGLKQCMTRKPCHKPFREMVILYDGQVAACNHDWFRNESLGDINTSSIEEVWHSKAYQELRAQHLNPHAMQDQTCINCDHWKICHLPNKLIGELYQGKEAPRVH